MKYLWPTLSFDGVVVEVLNILGYGGIAIPTVFACGIDKTTDTWTC